jgi:Tol biopolymer transport system component
VLSTKKEIVKKIPIDANWGISNDGTQLLIIQPSLKHAYNFNSLTKKWTDLDLKNECYEASWSPDKRYIAFGCGNGGAMDIYITDNASGSTLMVTNCQKKDFVCSKPSWSFDGQWLAYRAVEVRSGTNTLHAIYFFNVSCIKENNCLTKQTGPINSDSNPTWSPTNELILAFSNSIKFYKIKEGSIVLSKETKTDVSDIRYISSSPDGEYISYGLIDNQTIYLLSQSSNTSEVFLQDENIIIIGWLVIS